MAMAFFRCRYPFSFEFDKEETMSKVVAKALPTNSKMQANHFAQVGGGWELPHDNNPKLIVTRSQP
jgi:hypothetical protein